MRLNLEKLIKEMKKDGKSEEWIFTELKDFVLPAYGKTLKTSKDIEALRKLIKKVKPLNIYIFT